MTTSPAVVVQVEPTVCERIRRVVVEVDEPERLGVPAVADAAVAMYFPDERGELAPMTCRDGVWGHHDVDPAPEGRNYSIRYDQGDRLVIDFALHDHGVAADWIERAATGDRLTLAYGRSWYRPDPDADWVLLVADLAGLPALARIVEELPREASGIAVVEVPDEDALAYLPEHPGIRVVPTVGSGNGDGHSRLGEVVTGLDLPAGRGYCWLGAEAAQSRAVRKYLRREQGWQAGQFDIIGYWRFDSEEWARRFAPVQDEMVAVYTGALAAGKSDAEASEEFDTALERAGL